MKDMFRRTLAWKLAVTKCALLVVIGVGTIVGATMQGWDENYVSSLRWWNWIVFVSALVVNMCNTIYTFLDKTYHTESEKIKQNETQILKKSDITNLG